jgi:hypothetical protein
MLLAALQCASHYTAIDGCNTLHGTALAVVLSQDRLCCAVLCCGPERERDDAEMQAPGVG